MHRMWATPHTSLPGSLIMSHPMTNSMWVTLLHFFARQPHQSYLTHDQQYVGDITVIPCHPVPWILINRQWVMLLYFLKGSLINCVSSHDLQAVSDDTWFVCQAVSSIPCHQQRVSDTAWFLCQGVSSIISHAMTNRTYWVALLYFCGKKPNQSCLNTMTNRMWVTLLVIVALVACASTQRVWHKYLVD